jgi:putative ABC transport system permease protein
MLRNYLKVAIRNLLKHRAYSLINIAGLTLGMASCIVILLFVRDELGYDRYHENTERIYRVAIDFAVPDQPIKYTAVSPPPPRPGAIRRDPRGRRRGPPPGLL